MAPALVRSQPPWFWFTAGQATARIGITRSTTLPSGISSSPSTSAAMARQGSAAPNGTSRRSVTMFVAVVDDVGAQRFALVGHSMGGDAIVHAARRLGDRVAGLVWVDVFRSLGKEQTPPEVLEAFLAPFHDDLQPRSSDSFATCSRGRRRNSSIASQPTWPPRPRGRARLAGLCAQPQPAILAALADITAPLVAINPDIAPTDVDSLRRARCRADRAQGRRSLPDARRPRAVQPDTRHDAGVLCGASP